MGIYLSIYGVDSKANYRIRIICQSYNTMSTDETTVQTEEEKKKAAEQEQVQA